MFNVVTKEYRGWFEKQRELDEALPVFAGDGCLMFYDDFCPMKTKSALNAAAAPGVKAGKVKVIVTIERI